MTKVKKEFMKNILENGTFHSTSTNGILRHDFYMMPFGNLVSITYKNNKAIEVTNYGR